MLAPGGDPLVRRYGSRYKGKACNDPAPYGSISGPRSAPWLLSGEASIAETLETVRTAAEGLAKMAAALRPLDEVP
jgi:hypothetical protein